MMIKFNQTPFSFQMLIAFLLMMAAFSPLYAQHNQTGEASYWIFFSQKDSTIPVEIPQQTLERRLVRAGLINRPWYDLPVDENYINSISSLGGDVKVVSRWLNAVSVKANQSALSRICSLPYVSKIAHVAAASMAVPQFSASNF